eukprot:scaffold35858_cov18-Tisochrysis_lutea.AAC.1
MKKIPTSIKEKRQVCATTLNGLLYVLNGADCLDVVGSVANCNTHSLVCGCADCNFRGGPQPSCSCPPHPAAAAAVLAALHARLEDPGRCFDSLFQASAWYIGPTHWVAPRHFSCPWCRPEVGGPSGSLALGGWSPLWPALLFCHCPAQCKTCSSKSRKQRVAQQNIMVVINWSICRRPSLKPWLYNFTETNHAPNCFDGQNPYKTPWWHNPEKRTPGAKA